MKTQHDHELWKKAIDLIAKIFMLTIDKLYPDIYGLTNQNQRSAISIPSTMATGADAGFESQKPAPVIRLHRTYAYDPVN